MKPKKYNPGIHHRRSIRLKGYDYSQEGLYFITICTFNYERLFGHIDNGDMVLTECGKIANNEWMQTGEMRKKIVLHEFVIMPNHLHGIIEITCRGTLQRAPTTEQFGKPTSNTIPTIVRGFKSSVTKQINKIRNTPGLPIWQRSYYEHIIRNEKSYNQISEYIRHNPKEWSDDKYYMD